VSFVSLKLTAAAAAPVAGYVVALVVSAKYECLRDNLSDEEDEEAGRRRCGREEGGEHELFIDAYRYDDDDSIFLRFLGVLLILIIDPSCYYYCCYY